MSESLGKDRIERRAGPFCFTETWHDPALFLTPHEHEHACLHFVLAGRYCETVAGHAQSFGPGTVLYKPAGVRHSNRFLGCGARTLRVELEPRFEDFLGKRASAPLHSADPGLDLVARRMHGEMLASDDLTPLLLEGLGRELLALLFRRRPQRLEEHLRLAEDCAARLRELYRESVRLSELARELGCDRTALCRAFRARFGVAMGEYLRRLRVAEVMRRLEEGDAPLAEIALETGFADQSHCTRVFRRLAGTTPAAWTRALAARRRWSGRRIPGRG